MDKRRAYARTTEYDLASQKNRILTQAAAGMGLGDTVLSEMSQSRKDSGRVSPLPWGTREGRPTRWERLCGQCAISPPPGGLGLTPLLDPILGTPVFLGQTRHYAAVLSLR